MLRPRLVKAEPPMSAERQALAGAIVAHADAERELAGLKAASEFGGGAAAAAQEAERALEAAKERLAQANAARATALVTASLAGAAAPADGTIRAARETVMAAEDELEAARSARATLKGRIPEAEERLANATMALERHAGNVLRAELAPHAASIAAEMQRLRREFAVASQAFDWLVSHGFLGRNGNCTDVPPLGGEAVWRDALAALQRDAATPLPLGN